MYDHDFRFDFLSWEFSTRDFFFPWYKCYQEKKSLVWKIPTTRSDWKRPFFFVESWSHIFKFLYITQLLYKRKLHNSRASAIKFAISAHQISHDDFCLTSPYYINDKAWGDVFRWLRMRLVWGLRKSSDASQPVNL